MLSGLSLLLLVGAGAWDNSSLYTFLAVSPYLSSEKFEVAREAAERMRIIDWNIGATFVAVNVYFMFLAYLPRILGTGDGHEIN